MNCIPLLLAAAFTASPHSVPIRQAADLELQGHFLQASNLLATTIARSNLPPDLTASVAFELDRLERIRKDFPLTEDALFGALAKNLNRLTRSEFDAWLKQGRFDSRTIDGERRFMVSSVSNLFFRYPELNSRRVPRKDGTALAKATLESCREITRAATAQGTPFVLPKRFEATMTTELKPGAVATGEVVRAWLPLPRAFPHQRDIEITGHSGLMRHVASADSPIRSALLEVTNEPIRLNYRYTAYAIRHTPARSASTTPTPSVASAKEGQPPAFTNTAPHVNFTPEMRQLAAKIAGTESDPRLKAKRFHDWIAENIRYSYAVEYSTVRDLGEYCRSRGYGDCGQEAFLFITLCRLSGIPARWQSGWSTFPGAKTIHDWAEIYLEPHGWIPVDPYMGIYSMQYAQGLTPSERREIRDFYFGGLDQYRMAANSDHSQTLAPAKETFRSDTVDFQRGELESSGTNIYFDRFSYDLEVREEPGT